MEIYTCSCPTCSLPATCINLDEDIPFCDEHGEFLQEHQFDKIGSECLCCSDKARFIDSRDGCVYCSLTCALDDDSSIIPHLRSLRKPDPVTEGIMPCRVCNEPCSITTVGTLGTLVCSQKCLYSLMRETGGPPPKTKEKSLEAIVEPFPAFLAAKAEVYGEAFEDCGKFLRILFPAGVPPDNYERLLYITRVYDKLCRIAKGAKGEENPVKDILGYSMLELLREQNDS